LRELTVLQAINEGIREEMERDERVFLIGEDLWGLPGGPHGVYKGLPEQFGSTRVIQTPISESALMGATVGAAATGMRPIVEIMHMDFMTIAMDQIVNHAAKLRYMTGGQATLPLVMRTPAGSGQGNAAQHSQSLEAWLVHVPGLKVVMPSTPYDAKGLMKSAIRDNNPVMYIEHKVAYNRKGPVPEEEYLVPLGKADVKREGTDVTIIATAYMVYMALQAADRVYLVVPAEIRAGETRVAATPETVKKLAAKNEDLRRQGFFGPAMLPYSELEYGGIVDRLKKMDSRFRVSHGKEGVTA